MAALCDVFVMDAFGTAHRAEASTHGVALAAPVACAGPLLAAELDALGRALDDPDAPARRGRRRLEGLDQARRCSRASIAKVDQLVVGGGIANTFLAATGVAVGKSSARARHARRREAAARAGQRARRRASRCRPTSWSRREFAATALGRDRIACGRGRRRRDDPRHRAGVGASAVAGDRRRRPAPSSGTARSASSSSTRSAAGRRRWPRRSRRARRSRSRAAATRSPRSKSTASSADISYISTGGGAFLEFVEGKTLPAVAALERRASGS